MKSSLKTNEEFKPFFIDFLGVIEEQLLEIGFSYRQPKKLANAIKGLSDHFIGNEQRITPWNSKEFKAAYLAYYTPLNLWRLLHAYKTIAEDIPWQNLNKVLDFGMGSGAASFALDYMLRKTGFSAQLSGLDQSEEALGCFKEISKSQLEQLKVTQLADDFCSLTNGEFDFAIASYSLNELEVIPEELFKSKYLLIVEPSSSEESRLLMAMKESLIDRDFQILAPCSHQNPCPMLTTKKLWCHARTPALPQSQLNKIEEYLPFKNRTLTYSYLFASKQSEVATSETHYRVVSDPLKEKGKTRWNICSDKGIETLSLLHRVKLDLDLNRGDLLELDRNSIEQKKTELRIKDLNSVSIVKKDS